MTALWLLLSLLAALGFYLACAHQRLWSAARTRALPLRIAAGACCGLGLTVAAHALGLWSGVFSALTAFMLFAVALPYFDAWRGARRPG